VQATAYYPRKCDDGLQQRTSCQTVIYTSSTRELDKHTKYILLVYARGIKLEVIYRTNYRLALYIYFSFVHQGVKLEDIIYD